MISDPIKINLVYSSADDCEQSLEAGFIFEAEIQPEQDLLWLLGFEPTSFCGPLIPRSLIPTKTQNLHVDNLIRLYSMTINCTK